MGIVMHDPVRQRLISCYEEELRTLTDARNYRSLADYLQFTKTEQYINTVDMLSKKIEELKGYMPKVTGAMDEANIVVNGRQLTNAQSMAVRVAICSYMSDLNQHGLGDDEHGRQMTKGYLDRLDEVMHYVLGKG